MNPVTTGARRVYRLAQRLAARPLRPILDIAGRAYVPGSGLADAMKIARHLAEEDVACTLGYFHGGQETGHQLAQVSRTIIDAIADLDPPGYISVKAPAFGYDPTVLATIVAAARERDMLVHFDSHEHVTADATLECLRQAAALGARTGLTIPGRWRRSPGDAEFALQIGTRVRVVKGEWADPDERQRDMRRGCLEVIDRLAGRANEVAVATHDAWLARESLRRLQAAGTACELELLNGLPKRALRALARELDVPVRVYVPFGIAWRPYALGKVAENPRMLWWLARDTVAGLCKHGLKP